MPIGGKRDGSEPGQRPFEVEPQIAAQWARVRGRLQSEVGDVEYRTWLRQMWLGGIDGDEVTVRLPTGTELADVGLDEAGRPLV